MTGPPVSDDLLRVLIIEDSPSDVELLKQELRRESIRFTARAVEDRDGFLQAIGVETPDIILADYALPRFAGMDALALSREHVPGAAFVMVSSSLDEDAAVRCIKAGAADYVLKDRLVRLGSAVTAALELRRARAERQRAEDALRRSEEQFLHAQKMEAVGRLAGGVAHDFNNLLTAIFGYSDLLLATLEDDDERKDDVSEIRHAAERAAVLTRQLLAFSRKQVLELRYLQVGDIVHGMEMMLRRIIGADVELLAQRDPEPGWVRADPGQLEQVIANLVVNARDAMPSGGRLTIETRNTVLDAEYAAGHADVQPGAYVMLAVSDTGTGMDANTKQHLFEPFFTTKAPGKGTGLGLATVYGIVKQSGGHIFVYSEPGYGTTFRIYLPRVEPDAGGLMMPPPPPVPSAGVETVLVVEDEPAVRALVRRALERHGYKVLAAASGDEGMRVSREYADPIHVLLTDVVMPGASGQVVAELVRAYRPEVRVLYMSGYSELTMSHHVALPPNAVLIQKPFSPDALVLKVREVLEAP